MPDSGVAYPRRADGAMFGEFDGTLESAQRIANITGIDVGIRVRPDGHYMKGDTVRVGDLTIGATTVFSGDYVVQKVGSDEAFDVMDYGDFHRRYSKDGS